MTISDPIAISIEQLGKRYRLGTNQGSYRTLRDIITDALKAPFQGTKRSSREGPLPPGSDTIWALKDVFLEVPHGEILGIIGRNGAGKTTLLKVLSRITEPTEGRVKLQGRVGSLLEVGTGFHHELTGRENIFMNGAILGMSRREIQAKFEEIVAFAEIEPFLDTPLKRYSTGMGTRLAFAIAAHLDTDILLVDEVLAVGDLGFRKKCLGKMQDVTQAGRTVLFVSHDMNSIRRLCRSAVWLDQGRVMATGEVQEVVTQYEASFLDSDGQRAARVERRDPPKSQKWFSWVSLTDAQGNPASVFKYGDSLHLTIGMEGRASHQTHYVEWYLNEISHGNRVAFGGTHTFPDGDVPGDCKETSFIIGPIPLTDGNYSLSFIMGVAGIINLDFWYDAITFEVTDADPFKTGYRYRTNYAPSVITYKLK
jgi:lipopolysaccharide transport system ATP-binding protein